MSLPAAGDILTIKNFRFCCLCNGLYRRGKCLRDHVLKSCKQRSPENISNQESLKKSKAEVVFALPEQVSNETKECVAVLRDGDEKDCIKRDSLILYIAHLYLRRKGPEDTHESVRQRLRLLARFVVASGHCYLKDALLPAEFGKLCDTVRANFVPNTQLRLGHFLRGAAETLCSVAIQSKMPILKESMLDEMRLFQSEWKHRISHRALMLVDEQTFNQVAILPVSRDILKIRNYLEAQIKQCLDEYDKGVKGIHAKAKKLLGCKVTVFNKRRGSEFIKSTRVEIIEAKARRDVRTISDVDENLSPIEKELSAKMKLLRVRGKMGKGVPVLLEPDDYKLLEHLLSDPECSENKYLFQSSCDGPYRGDTMLDKLTKKLPDLESPSSIRATALRKYLATVIQVMALPKYQNNWVAQHLGHTPEVHLKYYRGALDSVELAKISKLMYLVDHCQMKNAVGKDLNTIDEFIQKEDVFKSVEEADYDVSIY